MVISQRIKAKLCGADINSDFCWVEEISSKRRRNLPVKVYRGFKLNSQSYFEGDCVLINIDIQFGIMEENYEIARILECYSNGDKNSKGFVKVQWFTPFDKIRKFHRKYSTTADYPPMDADREIVKDMFTYENDVDVETICGHCYIKEVKASFSPSSIKRPPDAIGPFYICRFAYKKTSPYIFPLTEKDVYDCSIDKSPLALKEIANSPPKKILSSYLSNKSKTRVDEQRNSGRKNYVVHEENGNLLDRKRNVKRKLLDLDDDQENILAKKQKKEEDGRKPEREVTSEFTRNRNKGDYCSGMSILSPLKNNPRVSNNLKDTKLSLLSPQKGNSFISSSQKMSPFKKKVEDSSPKVTKTFPNSPLLKEKGVTKASPKSPTAADRNVDSIKTIGQCRGLRQGEISDLLVDDDEEDEDAESDDGSDDVSRGKEETKLANNTRKGCRVKKKLKTYLQESEEKHRSTSATPKRKASKKRVEDCAVSDDESARSQTPKKKMHNNAVEKSSKLESLKTPEKEEPKRSIKTRVIDESTTKKSKLITPKSTKKGKKEELCKPKTPKGKAKLLPEPYLPDRNTPVKESNTEFEQAKAQLHVSAVPSYLPCREDEFQQIFSFVEGKLLDSTGGCMYVSGVPGTGKTATIREVLRVLKECEKDGTVPQFQFLEVNSMKLTKPHHLWVQIWEGLTGQRATPDHAYSLFEKSLGSSSGPKRKSIFLLLDELDLLWTKKQDVMYNLFDLASRGDSRLIVITIANTMDLPERMMISRVQSRLGLTRMTFQPYTFKQLQEIIASRLQGIRAFDADAIQLVSRKVAAVSGDARRALDICRRATELAELKKMEIFLSPKKLNVLVGMSHVTMAISEMFSSPKIQAIKHCSQMAKYLLQAILTEFSRTGIEEAVLMRVTEHLQSICRLDGLSPPSSTDILKLMNVLSAQKVIFTEHSRLDLMLRIRLNISTDDVSYALSL